MTRADLVGEFPVITELSELEGLCRRLADGDFVAVDTEFVRDRTYFARLCLVQLAGSGEQAVIDPFVLKDLGPLRELLVEAEVVKVLHAARQDLEIFHSLWNEVPTPVFDTQVAATVAGLGEQVSFGTLVEELVGVRLQKAETLTDWSRRPLTRAQLEYAVADVAYLVPAYEQLLKRLEHAGRLEWLADEFDALTDSGLYQVEPRWAWRSIKGSGSLRPPQLAILREIASWRESTARERNLPRRWVLSDELCVQVARKGPADVASLTGLRGLSREQVRRDGETIVELVAEGKAVPADERPRSEGRVRPTPAQQALTDLMGCLLRIRAKEQGVTASVLASKSTLEQLAAHGEEADVPVLSGWRRRIVGDDLLALLDGRLQLVVRDGHVAVERDGAAEEG